MCASPWSCNVMARSLRRFGDTFPASLVRRLASSSVQFVIRGDSEPKSFVASGTLIWPDVVLCAAHSLGGTPSTNLDALFFYEHDGATATKLGSGGNITAKLPQAKVKAEVENGGKFGLDYALLVIEWSDWAISLPRAVELPHPSYACGSELLAIGHPGGAPTRAAAGKLMRSGFSLSLGAGASDPGRGEFSSASFKTDFGMSGGGVFNNDGGLVGVIKGDNFAPGATADRNPNENTFLNLGLAAGKMGKSRLRTWLEGGSPLLGGDPRSPRGAPPLPNGDPRSLKAIGR